MLIQVASFLLVYFCGALILCACNEITTAMSLHTEAKSNATPEGQTTLPRVIMAPCVCNDVVHTHTQSYDYNDYSLSWVGGISYNPELKER